MSVELRNGVYEITAEIGGGIDRSFCEQIRRSARSAPSNIAEGFARYRPSEFARFLEIARASLVETHNHLGDALELGYVTDDQYTTLCRLSQRAGGATTKLLLYLKKQGRRGER